MRLRAAALSAVLRILGFAAPRAAPGPSEPSPPPEADAEAEEMLEPPPEPAVVLPDDEPLPGSVEARMRSARRPW